ncbi:AraC family transcriptional regulator [Antrihabitans sp. YC2-6]|nr:AraC family transcriptional regulator [Antrihabitans sp. YC2-6]
MPRTPTSILVVLGVADERGVPAQLCFGGAGLTVDLLRQPDAEVTARQEQTVIANLLEELDYPDDLGLQVGNRYHLTTYGIFGFALISSPALRSAVEVGLRYLDLTFAFSRIRTRETDDEFLLVLDASDTPDRLRRFAVERDAAAIRVLEKELFTNWVPTMQARFTFPAPDDTAPYTQAFGVRPEFGADENVVLLPKDLIDRPLPQANEYTAALTQAQCRDLLEQRQARTGTSGQVRDLLLARPGSPPSSDQVARMLAISARTLRNRLAAEGTSFRGLLEEVRQRLAEEMLISGRLTVGETAERLGYVEISSFSQAFRRWHGMGPRAYRTAKLGRTAQV